MTIATIAPSASRGRQKQLRTNGAETITSELVIVTPKLAAEWLVQNTHNRNLRRIVVARYARDMTEGNWSLNGETIKFSAAGDILDGQHRLHAVVESGMSIPMFVIRGLAVAVQETIDRGLHRNLADALRLRGEKDCNNLAAAIANTFMLHRSTPTDHNLWPSTSEALQFLDAHPSLRESNLVGNRVREVLVVSQGVFAALHNRLADIDQLDADVFFDQLVVGAGLALNSPILKLREFLMRERTAVRRQDRTRVMALTIKAWNAYRKGNPVELLRWSTGGAKPESFPVPE